MYETTISFWEVTKMEILSEPRLAGMAINLFGKRLKVLTSGVFLVSNSYYCHHFSKGNFCTQLKFTFPEIMSVFILYLSFNCLIIITDTCMQPVGHPE